MDLTLGKLAIWMENKKKETLRMKKSEIEAARKRAYGGAGMNTQPAHDVRTTLLQRYFNV